MRLLVRRRSGTSAKACFA
jgi:hypothetical protein